MGTREVLSQTIDYVADDLPCQLIFTLRNELPYQYHLYDVELVVNGYNQFQFDRASIEGNETLFSMWGARKIIRATLKTIDEWCQNNPNTFVTFIDYRIEYSILYHKHNFVSDYRFETYVTYIDENGRRKPFHGMLNILAEYDPWLSVNDLWRVAKDTDYYLGKPYTVVDLVGEVLEFASERKRESFLDRN